MTALSRRAALYKDVVLDRLADSTNVAQFASFGPGDPPTLRRIRVWGHVPDQVASVEQIARILLERSIEHSANVRSYDPNEPKGRDFVYGVTRAAEISATVRRLAALGLYTIVNETIDVNDGGVSGVSYGGILEFAPGDTPRCVEKPGAASLPRDLGLDLLETVYGFQPSLDYDDRVRVEFSIHPLRRGFRRQHTVIWEEETAESVRLVPNISWPNKFSRLIGDKAFGLLLANAIGLAVPATTVVARRVAPFRFGRSTGSREYWIRTCPMEPVPGRFTTRRGWVDPFQLLLTEDPEGEWISSVLAQEGVDGAYSGAAAGTGDGLLIEGVAGTGEEFMQGSVPPQPLPRQISSDVEALYWSAAKTFGAVRFEWVHDGSMPWVVQLHAGLTSTRGRVIYPGQAKIEHRFRVEEGLEALRRLIAEVEGTGEGILLIGQVGLTSHFGDVLRGAHIPARLEPTEVGPENHRARRVG